jgi:hypothetical protein
MNGNLNDALPEPVSDENARYIDALIQRKVTIAAGIAVRLLHAMEAHFGSEAREVLGGMVENIEMEPRPQPGDPQIDLKTFCDQLDAACIGSHKWERIAESPDRVEYNYSGCLWAEVFRELGEPDLGFLLCAGDEPAVKAFNPALGFKRTKVLMHGDEVCDHVFFVEEER